MPAPYKRRRRRFGRTSRYRKTRRYKRNYSRKLRRSGTLFRKRFIGYTRIGPKWQAAVPKALSKLLIFRYQDDGFSVTCDAVHDYQALWQMRGNSLYDPDFTGVGVQPYGLDQFMPVFYQRYKVVASKISVYFSSTVLTANCPAIRCFIIPYWDTDLTYHDPSDLGAVPDCKQSYIGVNTKNGSMGKLTNYCTTKKMYPANHSDLYCTALYNANPDRPWYWLIYFDSSLYAALETEPDIYFNIKIKYYVKLQRLSSVNES